jgi:hypothetical protein
VVHELCRRLKAGYSLPVFSSDGLRLYFYALTAHFGHWISPEGGHKRAWQIATDFIYGQVKKLQRRRRLVKVERVMLWGGFELLRDRLKAAGLMGRLNTAFIERLNLTLRQGVALLTRRTWGTAQQMSELVLHFLSGIPDKTCYPDILQIPILLLRHHSRNRFFGPNPPLLVTTA